MWNRLALLGQQARIQSFWRDVFSLSNTRAPPALTAQPVEFTPKNSTQNKKARLQLRVLDLGLLQEGNVSVGVFAAIPPYRLVNERDGDFANHVHGSATRSHQFLHAGSRISRLLSSPSRIEIRDRVR